MFLAGSYSVPLRIDPHQLQFLPAFLHYVLDSKIKLTAHHHGVRLSGKLVKEIQRDRINFVVDIKARPQA